MLYVVVITSVVCVDVSANCLWLLMRFLRL